LCGGANAGADEDGCREESSKCGYNLVLDIYVRHFDFLLGSIGCFAIPVSEDAGSTAQAVPILYYLYISMIYA